jgi:hypothetical protein
MFTEVAENSEMPGLMGLIKLAATLKMQVKLKLVTSDYSRRNPFVIFDMDPKRARKALIRFMEFNSSGPQAGSAPEELRQFQQDHLHNVRQNNIRIHWTSLFAFFKAAGYDMEVWLQDAADASEVKLPARLNRKRKTLRAVQ